MVSRAALDELMSLSPAERIELAQDLWESVQDQAAGWELTEAQESELERRLAAHRASPNDGAPWQTVRQRL